MTLPRPASTSRCYHPSQHNTFTGRCLTPGMLDAVFRRAQSIASG